MDWKDWDRTNRVGVVAGAIGVVVLVLLLILVLTGGFTTGRQPPTPGPTPTGPSSASSPPTPSPTFSCSTATGPDCTEDLAAKEAARDKAYADAEAAYRTYESARLQTFRAGSSDALPTELLSVTGPEVQDSLKRALQLFRSEGWALYGDSRVSFTAHDTSPDWPTNRLVLSACVDDRSTTVLKGPQREFVRQGVINVLTTEMRQVDGAWKVWSQPTIEEVRQCPAA